MWFFRITEKWEVNKHMSHDFLTPRLKCDQEQRGPNLMRATLKWNLDLDETSNKTKTRAPADTEGAGTEQGLRCTGSQGD